MATIWKKAVGAVDIGEDKGDILAPLKRVEFQYMGRAVRHMEAGHPERAKYYQEQAESMNRLINQGDKQ